MTRTVAERRAAFRALHDHGCFVLPNPWDVGSARVLAHLGFEALASTSSGHAWTTGRPDNAVTRDEVLAHLTTLCAAVDLPINADFESGFATDPDDVFTNVGLAVASGVAGLSIEDLASDGSGLHERQLAIERIRAARAAIDASGHDVLLVARTEGMLIDADTLTSSIDRLVAFAEVGADCLYAPGAASKEDIVAIVESVAPKPVNVLVGSASAMTLGDFADLGVRRISVGGGLARVAWGAAFAAAEQLKAGSFAGLVNAAPSMKLNRIFDTGS